ncbi:hypothetical protein OAF09_00245 [bacterium]|nr:hypothetical protein [bacterium]
MRRSRGLPGVWCLWVPKAVVRWQVPKVLLLKTTLVALGGWSRLHPSISGCFGFVALGIRQFRVTDLVLRAGLALMTWIGE